ncbi:hypothetical protein HPB48_013815 [Haemaphysalis longicornis]|uniref:Peptidoglycan recognition protein family domain-containing protein n=1 Tax=Haemaphysalis longicornis TaxID=44386 RepID=A0A9J6GL13_HAELO|nr:hypothetical protein HPB48_013815 [Haemaphysalis longicornis]
MSPTFAEWWDIGYNFVIGGDGRVYEGRGFGVEGAHTLGHNTDSLGIAFTGDYRHTRPSDKMLAAAQRLIECGVRQVGYNVRWLDGKLNTCK